MKCNLSFTDSRDKNKIIDMCIENKLIINTSMNLCSIVVDTPYNIDHMRSIFDGVAIVSEVV